MSPLIESESRLRDSVEKLGNSLEDAAEVIATQQHQRRLAISLQMMNQMFDTSFAAIGLIDDQDDDIIKFYGLIPDQSPGEIEQWEMDLSEHVTLNTALRQNGSTQLLRDGLGSRQLYGFFEAANLLATNSLLFHPLATNGHSIGLLALPAPGNGDRWTEDAQKLVPGLTQFIAQALVNSQTPPESQAPEPEPEEIRVPVSSVPAAIVMDKVRVQDLEHQVEQLRQELQEAQQKRRRAEANAAAAQKQARYLASTLRTVQSNANNSSQYSPDHDVGDPPRQDKFDADADQTDL